jgi:hypothetical protein
MKPVAREQRRSTRIRLKLVIEAKDIAEPLSCEGETMVVNRHGALISTTIALRVGLRVEIRVISTGKHGAAHVAYIDPNQPRICGIGLEKPENIWGVSSPPEDWNEDVTENVPDPPPEISPEEM